MPEPLRIALVGLGKIARDQHVPAIAADPALALAAVASRNASLEGVPSVRTLEELLGSSIPFDAVALCTPPQGRRAQAEAALRADKHVLLEKPPGATVAELRPLIELAQSRGLTLFATWHSRFAPAVEPARALLTGAALTSVTVTWKEDVRTWHPGQDWIWQPGGLGVFDPGINALSIITRILPRPLFLTASELSYPANRHAPIAAELTLSDTAGIPVHVALDWRQTGPQSWDIAVETDVGPLLLTHGGARLHRDGRVLAEASPAEYPGLYAHFAGLVAAGRSDVDLTPLVLVADAFLLGRHVTVEPFLDAPP